MKSTIAVKAAPTWATMDSVARAIFVAKVGIMVCTFGFVFGGVLVEGMVYPELPGGDKGR
ncbi:MAG TPA: hypothetical protein VIM12_05835 [Noviherbaspirillum sp.]|jgi:hypothetical protein|uniref:hypothetical protein n=1 Tax=Noviherbaspirillum sp. TaxID=1926288 RepID=UPI002F9213D3